MRHLDIEWVRRHIMFVLGVVCGYGLAKGWGRWFVIIAGVAFATSWLLAAHLKRSTVKG